LKENVIMGRLIPAGTGGSIYRVVECESDEPLVVEPPPVPEETEQETRPEEEEGGA
jgi:hypothetical protein